MSEVHVIRKQIFQFDLEEAAQYRMLAERIRALGERLLPDALDLVLSEFVPPGVHLVIDKLELDIGTIRPEDLREQLLPRILGALRQALQVVKVGGPSAGVMQVTEGPGRQAELLRHFVLHGRLPWWAGTRNISVRRMAGELLLSEPSLFKKIFDRFRQDAPRLRRLLQHLDTEVLIRGWQRSRPDTQSVDRSQMIDMVAEVVHQLQAAMGREAAMDIVRLHLLQDYLSTQASPGFSQFEPERMLSKKLLAGQKIPIPLRAMLDRLAAANGAGVSRYSLENDGRPVRRPDGQVISGSDIRRKPAGKRDGRNTPMPVDETDRGLEAFGSYLEEGRIHAHRARSMAAEVIDIFKSLVEQRLPDLSDMIRDLGRAERVRRRILDAIPSPRLRTFFAAAVPGKREAIEWVESVYLETQRKVRPINQTNIRVQRSVDEITLELFTTTDLNAMGNAAFLRLHIRRMALKHHIRYRDLIRAIWRSSTLFDVAPDGRLYQILKELYEEAFPAAGVSSRQEKRVGWDEGVSPTGFRRDLTDYTASSSIYYDRESTPETGLSRAEREFLADTEPDGSGRMEVDAGSELIKTELSDDRTGITEPEISVKDGDAFDLVRDQTKVVISSDDPGISAVEDRGAQVLHDSRSDQDRSSGDQGSLPPESGTIPPGTVQPDQRMAAQDRGPAALTPHDQSGLLPSKDGQAPGEDISSEQLIDIDGRRPPGAAAEPGTSEEGLPGSGGLDRTFAGITTEYKDVQSPPGVASPADVKDQGLPVSNTGARTSNGLTAKEGDGQSHSDASSSVGFSEQVPPGSGSATRTYEGFPAKYEDGRQFPDSGSLTGGSEGRIPGSSDLPKSDATSTRRGTGSDFSEGIPGTPEAASSPGGNTPLDLLEPVPSTLLDILPRSVVRALILVKGTQVFGRHTRALQELISTYIRLSTPPQVTLEDVDVPQLLSALSSYLGVEPEFLAFSFRYSAGVHPGDALAAAVAVRFSQGQPIGNADQVSSRQVEEERLIGLVEHLSAYRWYYEASHVKALLMPALKGRPISVALFSGLIRLLYDEQAERVEEEWKRVFASPISPGLRRDPETLLDEARHAFIEATLSGAAMTLSLPRIFARVRRILQPELTGPSVLPAGLSDIRGYFSPATVALSQGGGRKAAIRRENSILRFYHILELDLVLQGVGDRFFDNIPFSFELLLTKYRGKLLEILHDHRFNPELAQFFAYADPSGIFEQIRRILPPSQTDRITRTFRQASEILLRSRWLTLGRDELTAFVGLDAYPFLLSPDLEPPVFSEVVFEVVRRAAAVGLLSARFREILAGSTDAEWMAQMARIIGTRRRDQIFPQQTSGPPTSSRAGIARYRSLLKSDGIIAPDETAALTLLAILDAGRFPEGHVLRSADPASHPDYLKRLASTGNVIERVFTEPGEGYGLMMSGLLDRGQLIRAVAAKYRLRRDQVRRLTQSWFDRAATDGWQPEDLLEALLQSPVSSDRSAGRPALNRAALKLLTKSGRVAWWDMLIALQNPARSSDESLDGLKPSDVTDKLRGSQEDWMELYFGMMQSPQLATRGMQRVLGVWMRGLAVKPGAGTRRQRFRALVESMLRAMTADSPVSEPLHRAWLEAQAFFDGLTPTAVRQLYDRLIRAGMPEDILNEHLVSRGIDLPKDNEEEARIRSGQDTKARETSFQESLLRGTITPEALAALWRPGSRDAAQILSALKNWVTSLLWNARAAERLSRALPPQALSMLLERLSPAVDLRRIIDNWSAFLQQAGIYPDRQQAETAIRRVMLTHRLWLHQTARRLQVELFQLMGIPEALRRGDISADVLAEGIDGVPAVFLNMAAEMLATRSKLTTDELLALWPVNWTEPSIRGGRPRPGRGVADPELGIISSALMDFLETGLMPTPPGNETPESVYQRIVADVRAAGPGGFLTLPSLHESLVSRALEFFQPQELAAHVFSSLRDKTTDAALRRYLEVFADLARHTRVRQSDLIRFLKTYRRFFATGGRGPSGQTEAFLRAALVIPAFAQLTRRTLSALPRSAWRATRSPFLQYVIRRQLKEKGLSAPDTDALTVFFLRTGLLHPDADVPDLPSLYGRIRQLLTAGDPDLRATIFLYAKDRMARRRIRELFEGLEESVLYEWILPGLTDALRALTNLLRLRFGIDIWRAAGARSARDRQERVLSWWSQTRPLPVHPLTILRFFMAQVMEVLDDRQWLRIRQVDPALFTEEERRLWNELRALLPDLIEAPADAQRRLSKPVEEEEATRMNEPDTDSNPVDGITVQNGGLVILWPYLGRLFTRLGLSDGKTFPGEEEQSRAIRLTEYLVTGSVEMEEHQLALNKLLCGASLDFQVPASIELSAEEEELCGKMLQGVIRNWEKMKTTRPNTFRETFLKREARLYKVEDRWELVVARKPYDMLLDSLPWNISMIQLSWMPERLVVHWK
jgi:hypothetical protein